MTENSLRCSVIVRAYNEERHIGRLLRGIFEQSIRDIEVIVVDSGSTDRTVEIVESYPSQVISISPKEFTFGRSLNIGCERARGEYLVFASAHVYPVYPDWLERLVAPFEDPKVALAYGKQRGDGFTHFSESQHFAKLYPEQTTLDQPHPFCNNANAAVRRKHWVEHRYDEELSGLEDLEWAMWAKSAGHRIAYIAEAEVIHVHEETPKQVYNRYRREAIALKRLRPQEHFGFADFLRLYASNLASDARHALSEGAPVRAWPAMLWFRFMQFWGTYRGFVHRGPLSPELQRAFYYPRGATKPSKSVEREVPRIDYTKQEIDAAEGAPDSIDYSKEPTQG